MSMTTVILMLAMATTSANEYVSYDTPKESINQPDTLIIDYDKKILWVGHAGRGMRFCQQNDRRYCFESSAVSFAVPKEGISVGESWKENGINYKVDRVQKISSLGISVDCFVIVSLQKAKQIQFFYSTKQGLVAMWFLSKNFKDGNFFISTEENGFPHPRTVRPESVN